LASIRENILSVAVVPVGITRFRKESALTKVSENMAGEVLEQIFDFNRQLKQNLVLPSDEFFMLTQKDFPKSEFYTNYGQLEDGVGTVRLLLDSFKKQKKKLPKSISKKTSLTMATGLLASYAMKDIVEEFNKINNLSVDMKVLKSYFWGDDITVAGLITGKDILDNLSAEKEQISDIIIPSVMLRDGTDVFLDDMNVKELETTLDSKFHIIQNPYSCEEMVNLIRKL
jgi:putative radical SAM enzyme (TIGR03279 family)